MLDDALIQRARWRSFFVVAVVVVSSTSSSSVVYVGSSSSYVVLPKQRVFFLLFVERLASVGRRPLAVCPSSRPCSAPDKPGSVAGEGRGGRAGDRAPSAVDRIARRRRRRRANVGREGKEMDGCASQRAGRADGGLPPTDSNYRDAGRRDSMALRRLDRTGLAPPRHQRVNILRSARPHARASVARPPSALFTQSPPAVPSLSPSTVDDRRRAPANPVPVGSRIDTIEDSSGARSEHHAQAVVNRDRWPAGSLTRARCGRDSGLAGPERAITADRATCRRRRSDCRLCSAYVTRV